MIDEYGFYALSYNFFYWIKNSMVIWCDNIDIKENFWKDLDDQIFLCILN
jgi:hypothetical protein